MTDATIIEATMISTAARPRLSARVAARLGRTPSPALVCGLALMPLVIAAGFAADMLRPPLRGVPLRPSIAGAEQEPVAIALPTPATRAIAALATR